MSDMAEIFNAMREADKERRHANLEAAGDIAPRFTQHTPWHWSITCDGDRLDYWPSKNKWRWRDKSYTGTPKDLLHFVAKREASAS